MQIHALTTHIPAYDIIYLSPHLDDAALSCGGTIAAQTAAGERVLVVTVCTASPAPDSDFNQLALEFHAEWELAPADVVTARLREDQRAMDLLGCDYLWAGLTDAIYRVPTIYNSKAALFGQPIADDPLFADVAALLRTISVHSPAAQLVGPLAVGSHVDHLATYAALRRHSAHVHWYEDLPYGTEPGATAQRRALIGEDLVERISPIADTLATKLLAVAAYASQLNALFAGLEPMRQGLSAHAQRAGGERTWVNP